MTHYVQRGKGWIGGLLAVLLVCGCASRSQVLDPRNPRFPPLVFSPPQPETGKLSGGAPVFLSPDHTVPLIRIYAAFRGGSIHDPGEKAGLAQVAGLAWRAGGTKMLGPEALDDEIEGRGIELTLGLGRDKGWATLSVLPPDLDRGLEILSSLLLEPSFAPERVAWAVAQVREGIRREEDDPDSLAFRELRRALYRGHPRGVIPTLETVGRVAREDLVELQGRLLKDSSWAVGVAGDFEPGPMLELLEKRLSRLSGKGSAFPLPDRPADPLPRLILVPKALPQSTLVTAWFGPNRLDPAYYPLELCDEVLGGGGFQSRLVKEIRSNRGLAYSVGSFYDAYREFGVLGAHAATKKETTAEVLGLISNAFAEAASKGFAAEEVGRAREVLFNRHLFRYDDPANLVREKMALFLDGLPLDLSAAYLAGLAATSGDEVSRAAAANYGKGPGVTVVVGDVDPADPAWGNGRVLEVVRRP